MTITDDMTKALLGNLKPIISNPIIQSENKIITLLSKIKCEGQITIHSANNFSLILVKLG